MKRVVLKRSKKELADYFRGQQEREAEQRRLKALLPKPMVCTNPGATILRKRLEP